MIETPDYISENILEQALQKLSAGENFDSVVNQFSEIAEQKAELSSTLQIAQLLSTVPKTAIPTPTKQFRYAQKVSFAQKFLQLFVNNKIPVFAAVFALMLISGYSAIRLAENSLPGDKLYGLKLIGEEARMTLTFDQDKVASLHLALAEKRLDETKRVIEINDPVQEATAIAANQTNRKNF